MHTKLVGWLAVKIRIFTTNESNCIFFVLKSEQGFANFLQNK